MVSFPYRVVVFDLDGTLYRGTEAIPGAIETVAWLRERGVGIRYLTNNSSLRRVDFAEKLTTMGFACTPEEVHSSASGAAAYLKQAGVRSVFVVGMPGLVQTLRESGLAVVNADSEGVVSAQGEPAEAVLSGICRTLTYPLLDAAMQQVLGGAQYIATNADSTFPLEGGRFSPGAGTIVAALQTCTGVAPLIVGKPAPTLVQVILNETGLTPEQVLVVGDREDTDIAAGIAAGCPTYLVLSGVAKVLPEGQMGGADVSALRGLAVHHAGE